MRVLFPVRAGLGGQPVGDAVGVQGFANTNFYRSAAGVTLATDASGFGVGVMFHVLAVPLATFRLVSCFDNTHGFELLGSTLLNLRMANGAGAFVNSPTSPIVAGDVGKTILLVGQYDAAGFARLYRGLAEVGAGNAVVGYTAPAAADKTSIGIQSTADTAAATDIRIVGACAWIGTPTLADIQAWNAASKAAYTVVDMGGAGVTPGSRWRASENLPAAATWTAGVSGKVLTKTGTLSSVIFTPVWE